MIVVREYLDIAGRNRYKVWFDGLDPGTAARVTVILERIAAGNKSSLKSVGEGVTEYKNDSGSGLRIYFGKDGEQLVILLGGGSKATQPKDIAAAKVLWNEYKDRKKASQKIDKAAAEAKQKIKAKKKR